MLSFYVIISGAGLASLGPRDRPSYFVAVLAFESTALLVLEPSEVVPCCNKTKSRTINLRGAV